MRIIKKIIIDQKIKKSLIVLSTMMNNNKIINLIYEQIDKSINGNINKQINK